jgi:PAS domain S-box-containing protein
LKQRTLSTSVESESEARLRLIADTIPAYVAYVASIEGELHYLMANRMYVEQFNRPADQIIGHSVAQVLGTSFPNVKHHLEGALAGVPQHFITRMRTTGGDRYLNVAHVPDRAPDGTIRGVIVHGLDVTDRVIAEEALRHSESRFRSVADTLPAAIFELEADGVVRYANCWFEAFTGRGDVDLRQIGWYDLVHPEDLEAVQLALPSPTNPGSAYSLEFRILRADGVYRWLLGIGRPVYGLEGAITHWTGAAFDVTERKQGEDALIQAEKLAAVGRLASSIAHEINNPLESVVNLLYLIETTTLEDPPQALGYARLAQQELARVSQIATQTLRFFKQSTSPRHVDLAELLESVLSLYQGRLLNSGVRVDVRISGAASILCFEGELRQVLNNLIGNSIDAMRSGGRLSLRARPTTERATGRAGVRLTVADTGHGMDASTLARIFEPFFTTKGISGTGLGLWVSSGIVQKHHGRLRVRSSLHPASHGTVFTLFLPDIVLPGATPLAAVPALH